MGTRKIQITLINFIIIFSSFGFLVKDTRKNADCRNIIAANAIGNLAVKNKLVAVPIARKFSVDNSEPITENNNIAIPRILIRFV